MCAFHPLVLAVAVLAAACARRVAAAALFEFELVERPSEMYCSDSPSFNGWARGAADCERLCAGEPSCEFMSLWPPYRYGLHWCRLTRECSRRAATQWEVSIFKRRQVAMATPPTTSTRTTTRQTTTTTTATVTSTTVTSTSTTATLTSTTATSTSTTVTSTSTTATSTSTTATSTSTTATSTSATATSTSTTMTSTSTTATSTTTTTSMTSTSTTATSTSTTATSTSTTATSTSTTVTSTSTTVTSTSTTATSTTTTTVTSTSTTTPAACNFANFPTIGFYWDPGCLMGMLGCNADGRHVSCRYCGSGPYRDIPCPAWTPLV